MEYEDSNADLIDLSDDGFFAQANSLVSDINMETADHLPVAVEVVKQEPQESTIEVNDRTCTECRIQLSCRAELEKHRSLIHKLLCYVQCPACKEMFSSYHFLKEHRKKSDACALDEAMESLEFVTIAKPLFPYSSTVRGNRFCPLEGCFEVFLKQENLQLHLKAHGLFSCSLDNCKMTFDKAHDLALHESSQHSREGQFSGFKCSRCSFHVGGQYQFMLHFLGEHLNINVFTEQCSICRKGYLQRGAFLTRDKEIHFRTHHDVKGKDPKSIFRCDVDNCDAFFIKESQLTSHKIRIHLVEQDSKFSCSICGVKLLNQSIMIKHRLQAHSNLAAHEIEAKLKRKLAPRKGKYSCMYCGNQYTSKYSLLIHSKVHDHLKNSAKAREDQEEGEGMEDASQSQLEAGKSTAEKGSD